MAASHKTQIGEIPKCSWHSLAILFHYFSPNWPFSGEGSPMASATHSVLLCIIYMGHRSVQIDCLIVSSSEPASNFFLKNSFDLILLRIT